MAATQSSLLHCINNQTWIGQRLDLLHTTLTHGQFSVHILWPKNHLLTVNDFCDSNHVSVTIVTVTMNSTPENKQAMKKYEELINHPHKKPVNGQFEDITSEILERLDTDTNEDEN